MSKLLKFFDNNNGNIAITASLLMLPLMASIGIAVDYSTVTREQSKLKQAADAAILAGVKETRKLLGEGLAPGRAIRNGEKLAEDVFSVNGLGTGLKLDGKFTPSITHNGSVIDGTVNYSGAITTSLMAIAGFDEIALDIVSSATISAPDFAEIFFVIDNSPSMGVGATSGDIVTLENSISCAFACHAPANGATLYSNMAGARASGATLKIDVVRNAISQLLDELETGGLGTTVEVGLFTFSNTLTELSPPTTNFTNLKSVLGGLDLVGVDGQGGTSYDFVMQQLESEVGTSGDGTSAASPRRIVVLLTDGVSSNVKYEAGSLDFFGNPDDVVPDPNFVPYNTALGDGSDQWHIQGFNPASCSRLKNIMNVDMYVINTDYVTSFGIVNADNRLRLDAIDIGVKPFISDELGRCASDPSKLFNAKDGPAIEQAFDLVIQDILRDDLHLTR